MSEQFPYELGKLIPGLTYDEYHEVGRQFGSVRSSTLKAGFVSMAHLYVEMTRPKQTTAALEFGQKVHSLFESPGDFRNRLRIEPEFSGKTKDGRESNRSAEAKEKRAAWIGEQPLDAIIVTQPEAEQMIGIVNAALNHRIAGPLLKDSIRETSLFVKDPETSLVLQCRPDAVTKHGFILDIKTTRSAHRNSFIRDIYGEPPTGFYYVLQAAHYVHCAKLAGLSKADAFTFVAIEKEPPFALNLFPLDEGKLQIGEYHRRRITQEYAEALKNNKWPGFPEKPVEFDIPQWVKYEMEVE